MIARSLGWDLHRKFSKVSLLEMGDDGEISVVERARLEHDDLGSVRAWLSGLEPGLPVAIEAAFGWPWVADMLEAVGLEPHLGHPPAIRALAKHEAKTDRCDADRLGRFQLRGTFPESYLAPPEVRQIRERTRYRMALVALQTGIKNRVQAILHRLGVFHPFSDLFGKGGRAFLEALDLPEASREVLLGYLALLDQVAELIGRVERWMRQNLKEDEAVRLLKTIPGVGLILAHVIRAEIGQIDRFPSRRHLSKYSGLGPLSDDSADRHGRRHCPAACNRVLRWALVEAATGVLATKKQQGRKLRQWHARLCHDGRHNKSQAKVALAHKVADAVYVVWSKGQPYTDTPPPRPGSDGKSPNRPKNPKQTRGTKRPLRSDQPRHPMVRQRRQAVGQTDS